MAIESNRVELAGIVSRIRGGHTRYGGYWLLMEVAVEEDGKTTTFPVWWFGGRHDDDLYTSVAEGDEVEIVGQLRWGKDGEDRWELRIQALSFGVTERGSRKGQQERSERNGRNERRDRTERRERNGRSKHPPDEEAPF